jgi:carbon monoxide dehydrogenase subunit G
MKAGVRSEVEIEAPAEAVWATVMDPHRLGEWVTTHRGLGDRTPRRLGEGSCFEQDLDVAGARFRVRWTVTELDEPTSVTWSGDGPAGSTAKVRYELDPREGATLFAYENSFDLPGGPLGRIAKHTVGDRVARREARRTLQNLKRLVESEG